MKNFENVLEPWVIYDTIIVCSLLKNAENHAGFFTTFAGFGAKNRHIFFKQRSRGIVHLAYNNMDSEDRVDYVFHVFGLGIEFFGPPTPFDVQGALVTNPGAVQEFLPSFWACQLPRHTAATFRVAQNDKIQIQSLMGSPGYGPVSSGAALGIDDPVPDTPYVPEFVWTTTQGIANQRARYGVFTSQKDGSLNPIAVPKGETIELELTLTEYARNILTQAGGPGNYITNHTYIEVPLFEFFPIRYGIRASLWGYREVQQRGQLHAAGYPQGKGAKYAR